MGEAHKTDSTDIRRCITQWRANPAQAVRELFKADPDPWQVEALDALFSGDKGKVAIRACHGPGKTTLAAWAVIIFGLTHYPYKVPCTGPSGDQLKDVLWAEIAKWLGRMPEQLKAMYRQTTERLELIAEPKTAFAVARTARQESPDALQGFHSENLMFVIDEAPGVHDKVFEVARGALTGPNAKVLMIGNPTRTQGYFHQAFHEDREQWHCMRVSAEDSPRVTAEYIDSMAKSYGEESNTYLVRVLGEFPTADDDAVMALEDLESAVDRDVTHWGDIAWGVDVAWQGSDRSSLAKTCANAIIEPVKWWAGKDPMATVGIIVADYDATPEHDKPAAIYVDTIGIGAGVVARLKEVLRKENVRIVGVNVAETASKKHRYPRMRDELWCETAEWFAGREVRIPRLDKMPARKAGEAWQYATHDQLISELTLPLIKPMRSDGRMEVESKKDTKERVVPSRSPDLADAVIMTRMHRFSSHPRRHARGHRRQASSSRGKGMSGVV